MQLARALGCAWGAGFSPFRRFSTPARPNVAVKANRVYTGYDVYQNNGAMRCYPISPILESTKSNDLRMKKSGAFVFEAASIVGQVEECVQLRDWDPNANIPFYLEHNTVPLSMQMQQPDPSQRILKSMRLLRLPGGQANQPMRVRVEFAVPSTNQLAAVDITYNQLKVIQSLCDYLVPRLLAFDACIETTLAMSNGAQDGSLSYYAPGQPQEGYAPQY